MDLHESGKIKIKLYILLPSPASNTVAIFHCKKSLSSRQCNVKSWRNFNQFDTSARIQVQCLILSHTKQQYMGSNSLRFRGSFPKFRQLPRKLWTFEIYTDEKCLGRRQIVSVDDVQLWIFMFEVIISNIELSITQWLWHIFTSNFLYND